MQQTFALYSATKCSSRLYSKCAARQSNSQNATAATHPSAAQHSAAYLEEAILSECHKCNGHCRNDDASNGDEAADEDKQAQQTNARDLQNPHAQHRQGSVRESNLCLQCTSQKLSEVAKQLQLATATQQKLTTGCCKTRKLGDMSRTW